MTERSGFPWGETPSRQDWEALLAQRDALLEAVEGLKDAGMDDDGDCRGCGSRYRSVDHSTWCPWGRVAPAIAQVRGEVKA